MWQLATAIEINIIQQPGMKNRTPQEFLVHKNWELKLN